MFQSNGVVEWGTGTMELEVYAEVMKEEVRLDESNDSNKL